MSEAPDKQWTGLAATVALSAVVWGAGLVLHGILRLFLPKLMPAGPMLFVSSVLCMAAAFASVALLLRTKATRRLAALLIACAVAANLLANMLIPDPAARLVVGYSLIVLGFGLGSLLAGFVDSPRYMLPVCVVAAAADLWSVCAGPTRAIVDARSEIVQRHAFVAVPVAGAVQSQPIAGIGDVIFVALLLCIAARLGLPVLRTMAGMFIGLLVGLAVAVTLGGAPGLPFIGAGFAAATWKEIRPGKAEIVTTAVFIVALSAVFALVTLLRS